MNLIFPSRKDKTKLEVFNENKGNKKVIKNSTIYEYETEFDESFIREFLVKNKIMEGYEEYISRKMVDKLKNRNSKIMGILNATPDSFYEGSRIHNISNIDRIINEKPDIIDIGGESTRPGSDPVPVEKEIARLEPIIEYVKSSTNIPVSVDTRNHETLEKILKYNIDYINDISGFENKKMISLAADNNLKCIVMHMRGVPKNMQQFTKYDDLFYEINEFFYKKTDEMIKLGVKPENITLDPGVGFAKDFDGNIKIIRSPWSFFIGFDTLFGTSRKGFLGTITSSRIEERLGSTIGTSIYLNKNGVDILRVHDPKQNNDAIKVFNYLVN